MLYRYREGFQEKLKRAHSPLTGTWKCRAHLSGGKFKYRDVKFYFNIFIHIDKARPFAVYRNYIIKI